MLAAITAGEVPGTFTVDRTGFEFPTLTYMGARGAPHSWKIMITLLGATDAAAADAARKPLRITDEMLALGGKLPAGAIVEIRTESSQVGGKVRDVVPDYISVGKNLGKKNETNALTQALRDALGLFNKQQKRSLGLADVRPPPQLVRKYDDAPLTAEDFREGVTVQRKLNGVHFVAYKSKGPPPRIVRYSRTGAEYPGQDTIANELNAMYTAWESCLASGTITLPAAVSLATGKLNPIQVFSNAYFAGELYKHGENLNQISGQARRADNAGDADLDYNIFDVFFPEGSESGSQSPLVDVKSRDRQRILNEFFGCADQMKVPHPHIHRVENFLASDKAAVDALVTRFLGEGYEGGIVRRDAGGYRYSYNNYHSMNALKIKPTHDDEFIVVGYAQGSRGKDVGAVIWECEVPLDKAIDENDRRFMVVPKNITTEERKAIFRCLDERLPAVKAAKANAKLPADLPLPVDLPEQTRFERYVKGKPLTVEYKEISAKTGKPLQAKALAFRTYESGPGNDPIALLLKGC